MALKWPWNYGFTQSTTANRLVIKMATTSSHLTGHGTMGVDGTTANTLVSKMATASSHFDGLGTVYLYKKLLLTRWSLKLLLQAAV